MEWRPTAGDGKQRARGVAALCLILMLDGCGDVAPPVAVVQAHPAKVSDARPTAGPKWRADARLHKGMARIRAATDALAHSGHGHLEAAQVTALAHEVESAAKDIFAGCKLEPAADAALHPLLARVLAASHALRDSPGEIAQPIAELRAVLRQYPLIFSDPRWRLRSYRNG